VRNYHVGTVMGIPLRINISLVVFLPVLAWLIGSGEQIGLYVDLLDGIFPRALDPDVLLAGNRPILIGVAAALGLFVSVAIHELGHAWMARRYGLAIESITLWIFGGVAAIEIPREWDREFWIALAGPVTSVLLAAGFYLVGTVLPASLQVSRFVIGWLAVVNVTLAAFNVLPAFPMDGGRIFRALLARSRPYASATRTAARVARLFAILMAVLGVLSFNVVLVLVALFVYGAGATESRAVMLPELLGGVTATDVMSRAAEPIDADVPVADLVDRLLRDHQPGVPVVDAGTIVGVASLANLQGLGRGDRRDARVADVLSEEIVAVAPDAPAFDVLAQLSRPASTRSS
jgi:Zn-dependent protease